MLLIKYFLQFIIGNSYYIQKINNYNKKLHYFLKMQKLQISDLLNTISTAQISKSKNDQKNNVKASKATEQFLVQGNMKVKKIKKSDQIHMKRSFNYKATQQDMDKWMGIVKLNREKQTLDLTKKQKDGVKINFFPSKPVSNLQAKTDKILSQLNMRNQSSVIKAEQKQLNKLDPQEAKKRLIQARKHRTMVFYEEIKRKRISKIKSKLYHRIKKKQKLREEQKQIQNMTATQKSQYVQKLTKNRIKERINLRHASKNKHIQNLLRFNKFNKDSVQSAMNEVNQIRQKQLERNKIDQELLGNLSEQYDDQNYRQQAIMDLEKELQQMQKQQNDDQIQDKSKGLNAMKFMKVARQKQAKKDIDDAYKLINQLQNEEDSDNIAIDSDQEENRKNNQSYNLKGRKKSHELAEGLQVTRKIYGEKNIQINSNNALNQNLLEKKQFIKKNIKQTLLLGDQTDQLTKGINLQNLKDKYQPQRVDLQLNQELVQMNRDIFDNFNFQNNAVTENLREFQEDKNQNFENDIQPQKKQLKGWGNWTGPNIKQKKVDPQVQIRKKLAKIQQIKRKRKDGQLSNVIINQVRNKQLKDYMVRKLPHEYNTVEQFEYMNQSQVGPEWNSLTQFKANIKPKVIKKVGEVIEPIKMPKRMIKS